MANISLFGANYTDVPAVDLPKTGGGTARFHEVSGSQTITTNNTYDVTNLAQVVVSVSGGSPTLETVTKTYTPTTSQQTDTITPSTGYDGISEVDVTINAVATGTAGTPSATKGTVSNHSVSVTPSVTNTTGYITGGTKTGTAVTVSASELVSGTYTVSSSGTKDVTNYASISVASGGATASATKGTVSNHSVTVTPSVTRTAGYVTAGTASGTAVTVSASELVSGSQTVTENDTYDVTNLAELVVNVSGGGGSDVEVGFGEEELSSASSSIAFSGLTGEPTSFVVWATSELTTGASPFKVAMVVYDGTNIIGQTITNTNNAQVTYDSSSFSYTYNNGTLTISSTGAYFQPTRYLLDYTYGGTASNIQTEDVQVGSGATSITFTNLDDEPIYWSCIFKSNFSTSSGYQRVIGVVHDDEGNYGFEMDSSAKYSTAHWSASYNNGSLTITSRGTNAGGYFHQPGYYQLTYAISGDQTLQTKTVTPTESTQNVTADTAQGYTALKKVVVNPIPSSYVQPTATKGATTYTPTTSNQTIASGTYLTGTQTISGDANLVAGNIKSGTTIFGVTGTYSGGGGGSVSFDTKTVTASNYPVSLEFTGMKGEPKAFVCRLNAQVSSSGSTTYYYIVDVSAFGTTTHGNCFRIGSTRRVDNITSGYSWSYSGTTLTITSSAASRSASPGAFYSGSYELLYAY